MTDKELEYRLNHTHQVGIAVGLEQAAASLMDEAVAEFRVGNVEKASNLRRLAKSLETKAKKQHPGPPDWEKYRKTRQ
jgi:hypothetical protein